MSPCTGTFLMIVGPATRSIGLGLPDACAGSSPHETADSRARGARISAVRFLPRRNGEGGAQRTYNHILTAVASLDP